MQKFERFNALAFENIWKTLFSVRFGVNLTQKL